MIYLVGSLYHQPAILVKFVNTQIVNQVVRQIPNNTHKASIQPSGVILFNLSFSGVTFLRIVDPFGA